MELFQEKVLNRIPFFAAHYEGHTHAELGHHRHHDEEEAIPEARMVSADARKGNGN
jgi:hypothetical protein